MACHASRGMSLVAVVNPLSVGYAAATRGYREGRDRGRIESKFLADAAYEV